MLWLVRASLQHHETVDRSPALPRCRDNRAWRNVPYTKYVRDEFEPVSFIFIGTQIIVALVLHRTKIPRDLFPAFSEPVCPARVVNPGWSAGFDAMEAADTEVVVISVMNVLRNGAVAAAAGALFVLSSPAQAHGGFGGMGGGFHGGMGGFRGGGMAYHGGGWHGGGWHGGGWHGGWGHWHGGWGHWHGGHWHGCCWGGVYFGVGWPYYGGYYPYYPYYYPSYSYYYPDYGYDYGASYYTPPPAPAPVPAAPPPPARG
jgi:hypothetical protein